MYTASAFVHNSLVVRRGKALRKSSSKMRVFSLPSPSRGPTVGTTVTITNSISSVWMRDWFAAALVVSRMARMPSSTFVLAPAVVQWGPISSLRRLTCSRILRGADHAGDVALSTAGSKRQLTGSKPVKKVSAFPDDSRATSGRPGTSLFSRNVLLANKLVPPESTPNANPNRFDGDALGPPATACTPMIDHRSIMTVEGFSSGLPVTVFQALTFAAVAGVGNTTPSPTFAQARVVFREGCWRG